MDSTATNAQALPSRAGARMPLHSSQGDASESDVTMFAGTADDGVDFEWFSLRSGHALPPLGLGSEFHPRHDRHLSSPAGCPSRVP